MSTIPPAAVVVVILVVVGVCVAILQALLVFGSKRRGRQ